MAKSPLVLVESGNGARYAVSGAAVSAYKAKGFSVVGYEDGTPYKAKAKKEDEPALDELVEPAED